MPQAETDCRDYGGEKYRDVDEANEMENEDKNRLENYCVTAERYRSGGERNKARIKDKNSSENYCVTVERVKTEDEAKTAMIGEMVTLPKAEHGENDSNKACCSKSFDWTEDNVKVLVRQVTGHGDVSGAVQKLISESDASVTEATEIRHGSVNMTSEQEPQQEQQRGEGD